MRQMALLVMALALVTFLGACDTDEVSNANSPAEGVSDPGTDPVSDPGTDPVSDPVSDPGTDLVPDPGEDPGEDPGTDPGAQPGDEPQNPLGPDLSPGAVDAFTETSCAALDQTAAVLTATDSPADAGQVIVLPSDTTAYSIVLPATGVGYLTLEVPEWQAIIAQYTHHSAAVTILDPEDKAQEVVPLQWNGSCQDLGLTEFRTKFHKWGAFTLEITGEPDSEVWLMAIRTE